MILKGNQRGGGSQLAIHLMNSFDNEVVEVADVRGTVAQDLSGAFAEWAAEARATRCEKYIYSLSLSPDQAQGRLTREQYLDLIARTERSLKLVGQPRALVFHEKRDKDGALRQHAHVIWSRIDSEKNKAIQIAHDHLKLRTVAKEFARDNGLELPDGMKKDGKRDRFNDRAKQENLGEKQQQERTGITKAGRMAEIAACWTATKTGPEFVRAMEDKGYYLARGDTGRYVVVDLYGEIHSLYRQIEGVKSAEVKERLVGYPLDQQRDVESAQAYARQKLQQRQEALEKGGQEAIGGRQADEGNLLKEEKGSKAAAGIEKRSTALHERQSSRRAELDAHRADLYARQFRERGVLREMQAAGKEGVQASRTERQPKGLAAFLTRITGIGNLVSWVQNKADARREAAHKQQTQTLLRHHDRELKEMDRHYLALHRLEVRENRSASTAALREGYRKLRVRTFALRPEFDKALTRQEATAAAGGGRAAGLFNRLAAGMGFTKGDLQAAFERATAGKAVSSGDADTKGYTPADPEKLEQARQLRDELNRRQPHPGPDRDRER